MSQEKQFITELKATLSSEVYDDEASLGMYATDASLYQITPVVVVLPKTEEELIKAITIANKHRISILPRGGGTSLAGQTVGHSMILDFSKHMNEVLELNVEERWVRIQPGISRDDLNNFLEPHGYWYAPDPATSSRANVGGMIGNNSSGTKSILYGKTIDHLLETKVALADGTVLNLVEKNQEEYEAISNQTDREGELYKAFRKIIFDNAEEVERVFPKVMRRVGGYNFDEFTTTDKWNLAKIVCGSEGTLATTIEAKINLVPLPKHKALCVVHFETMPEAIRAVAPMLEFKPAAIEILDRTVIHLSKENLTTKTHTAWVEGDPASVQIVEFYGESVVEIQERIRGMVADLKSKNIGYAYPSFTDKEKGYHSVWMIRKKGLGLMLGRKSKKKAAAFIEDAAIPIEVLPEYIEKVVAICDKYETEAAVYAHASVGVIHVRPFLDFQDGGDVERFKNIAEETFQLVKHYKGSWSGEHGDGLVRSPFNERFFGSQLYNAFKEVKALFDPHNLMNPGKIVDAPPMDHNLRYGPAYKEEKLDTIFHYREDGGFEEAVHMCTGVGECRKKSGGTMCPSYKATYEEEHSTRGRANALRLAMSGQIENKLTDKRLLDTLDLCLSCKACKSECPSNVDMAKLKSEVWQKKYDAGNITQREKFIRKSAAMSKRFAGSMAPLINTVQSTYPFRWTMSKIAGIASERTLPSFAKQHFSTWYKENYKSNNSSKKVVLFADTYLNYHEINIGIAATDLLSSCGYDVILADFGCCQRPRISNGFLKDAKKDGTALALKLEPLMKDGLPILVCEPSCATALGDDIPDLIDDERLATLLKSSVHMIDKFLASELENGNLKGTFKSKYESIMIHGHCHQKAVYGTKSMHNIYDDCGNVDYKEIDSGCCGMAGSFGYEKEHYDISKKISELVLVPEINKLDRKTEVVACGVSCRHQIADFTDKKAVHWVESVEFEAIDKTYKT